MTLYIADGSLMLDGGALHNDPACACCDEVVTENCSCVIDWLLVGEPEQLNIRGIIRGMSVSPAARFLFEYACVDGGSSYEAWVNGGTFDGDYGYNWHGTLREGSCGIRNGSAFPRPADAHQALWGVNIPSGLSVLDGLDIVKLKSNVGFGSPMETDIIIKANVGTSGQTYGGALFTGTPSPCGSVQTYYNANFPLFEYSWFPFADDDENARVFIKDMGAPVTYPKNTGRFEFIPSTDQRQLTGIPWLFEPATVIRYDVIAHTAYGDFYIPQVKELDKYGFAAAETGPSYDLYYPQWNAPGVAILFRTDLEGTPGYARTMRLVLYGAGALGTDVAYEQDVDLTATARNTFTHTSAPFTTWDYPSRVSMQGKIGPLEEEVPFPPGDTATLEWVPIDAL